MPSNNLYEGKSLSGDKKISNIPYQANYLKGIVKHIIDNNGRFYGCILIITRDHIKDKYHQPNCTQLQPPCLGDKRSGGGNQWEDTEYKSMTK